MTVLVLAGDVRQFRGWCRQEGLGQREAIYVDRPEHVQGRTVDAEYACVGTWYECAEKREAFAMLAERGVPRREVRP